MTNRAINGFLPYDTVRSRIFSFFLLLFPLLTLSARPSPCRRALRSAINPSSVGQADASASNRGSQLCAIALCLSSTSANSRRLSSFPGEIDQTDDRALLVGEQHLGVQL
jgi:hypothetical protein